MHTWFFNISQIPLGSSSLVINTVSISQVQVITCGLLGPQELLGLSYLANIPPETWSDSLQMSWSSLGRAGVFSITFALSTCIFFSHTVQHMGS